MSNLIWPRGCWSGKTLSVYNGKCLDSGDSEFVLLKSQRLARCFWLGRAHSTDIHLESPARGIPASTVRRLAARGAFSDARKYERVRRLSHDPAPFSSAQRRFFFSFVADAGISSSFLQKQQEVKFPVKYQPKTKKVKLSYPLFWPISCLQGIKNPCPPAETKILRVFKTPNYSKKCWFL